MQMRRKFAFGTHLRAYCVCYALDHMQPALALKPACENACLMTAGRERIALQNLSAAQVISIDGVMGTMLHIATAEKGSGTVVDGSCLWMRLRKPEMWITNDTRLSNIFLLFCTS